MALANGGFLFVAGHVHEEVCQGERLVAYYPPWDSVAWLSIPRLHGLARRRAFLQRSARCVVEACRLTWSSCWLDAYTAAAMKHDVEIGGVLANGPFDQDESLIKR